MEEKIQRLVAALEDKDNTARYEAFTQLLTITEEPVSWSYEAWDTLAAKLGSDNSYQRSIGMSLLCNLSHSDPEKRLNALIGKLLALTEDEKFITRRQTLQSIWKIAWFNPTLRPVVVQKLQQRFADCIDEEHPNLLRRDIVQSLLTLAELTHNEALFTAIDQLIQSESDEKSRKTYLAMRKAK